MPTKVIPKEYNPKEWPWRDTVSQDYHVTVYEDKYPVSPGHRLYVPNFNSATVIGEAVAEAYRYGKMMVEHEEWDAFNIGINFGAAAGQTIDWPHVHLIPRFKGDVTDPVGGVRNVVPGKGNYKKEK